LTIDQVINSISHSIAEENTDKEATTIICPGCSKFVDIEIVEKEVTPGTQMFITVKCPNCRCEFLPARRVALRRQLPQEEHRPPSISRIQWNRRQQEEEE
jgi:hypothetical protein